MSVAVAATMPLDQAEEWTPIEWPDDLPYDDGEPMESPWHREAATLLKAGYIAAHGGQMDTYFVGCNMFMYYSPLKVRTEDIKGPDFFVVKGVDGSSHRDYWATWKEGDHFPNLIIELLSETTEANDMTEKKDLYAHVFRTAEYICIAPHMARVIGWRLTKGKYVPIVYNDRRWLWSEEAGLWLGSWYGMFMGLEATWPRWYAPDGNLVLLPDEAEAQRAEAERQRAEEAVHRAATEYQRAEAERQRADEMAERLAALEAELRRLRGE